MDDIRSKQKKIDVCFAVTPNCLPFAVITTLSIIDKLSSSQLHVHLLWADVFHNMSPHSQQDIFNTMEWFLSSKNIEITFYDVSNEIHRFDKQNIGMWGKDVSLTHYMYLLAPEFLSCDKVIYLDVDMIVNCDLMKVFDIDLGNHLLAMASPSGFERIKDSPNSGFIVLNLELWRKEKTLEKILPFGENLRSNNLCDQNLLYHYFTVQNPSRLLLLDKNYNVFPHLVQLPLSEIKIIHFAALPRKPWQLFDLNIRFSNLWWYYARQSPFYESFMVVLKQKQLEKKSFKNS